MSYITLNDGINDASEIATSPKKSTYIAARQYVVFLRDSDFIELRKSYNVDTLTLTLDK